MLYPVEMKLDPEADSAYRKTLEALRQTHVPFLVGGAYAFGAYTGILRNTKDLDLFIRPDDVNRALQVLDEAGFTTEITQPLWLAKARVSADTFVDLIYRSGNGVSEVDDEWFQHSRPFRLLGEDVRLCPPEECVWQKAFIMERERYDGADVAHYFLARGPEFDWERLVRRFGSHWRILLSHFIQYDFIYPDDPDRIPRDLVRELLARAGQPEARPARDDGKKLCRGSILSRIYHVVDAKGWDYEDFRFTPESGFTDEQRKTWRRVVDAEFQDYLGITGVTGVWKPELSAEERSEASFRSYEAPDDIGSPVAYRDGDGGDTGSPAGESSRARRPDAA